MNRGQATFPFVLQLRCPGNLYAGNGPAGADTQECASMQNRQCAFSLPFASEG